MRLSEYFVLGMIRLLAAFATTRALAEEPVGFCTADLEASDDPISSVSLLQRRQTLGEGSQLNLTSIALDVKFQEDVLNELQYNSNEHKAAGDSVKLSNGFAGSEQWTLPKGYKVTYGDVLALCGDYYGKAPWPISDGWTFEQQKHRFLHGPYECLIGDPEDPQRLMKFSEAGDVAGGIGTLNMHSDCSSYVVLAAANHDHFAKLEGYSKENQGGDGAWEAYTAGHATACETAAAGNLQDALIQNACASHYLSDLFAPGHLRQPRRKLEEGTAQYISKVFHDEDNLFGLNVQNARGDKWKAFGDRCYGQPENERNRQIQVEALIASAEAILQAQISQDAKVCIADSGTKELVPDRKLVQNIYTTQKQGNHPPLVLPATGQCGVFSNPFVPCVAAGPGKIADTRMRSEACSMKASYDPKTYVYYSSVVVAPVLASSGCDDSKRKQGFRQCV